MSLPTVNMIRRPVQLGNGDIRYEVTTQVVDAGDLPFVELFVASIDDPEAEKSDVLARIVTPYELRLDQGQVFVKVDSSTLRIISGDPFVAVSNVVQLTELARDRTTAIQRGAVTYLTSTVTLMYTSVTAAIAAYKTLLARLSQLVDDWRSFQSSFATNPSTSYTLPQSSIGVEDELTAAYAATKRARQDAETARDAARDARDACEEEGAVDRAKYDLVVADVAFLESARQRVTATVETATTGLILTGGTTLTAPGTYQITYSPNNQTKTFALDGGDPTSYETLLVRKRAQAEQLRTAIAAHDAECGVLERALRDAQAAVDSARATETRALASLQAVCPTFDPDTV